MYFLSHFLAKNELTYYVGERVGEEREGESCNPKKQRGRKQQWLFSGVTHCIAYENIGSFETPLTCVSRNGVREYACNCAPTLHGVCMVRKVVVASSFHLNTL